MRKFLYSVSFVLMAVSSFAQSSNVTLEGRWAKGYCDAVFRRGGYTFIGNGSYLEVYQQRNGGYERLDSVILPAPIHDLWVRSDTAFVFAACGNAGLQIIGFTTTTETFTGIIGSFDTPGFASGLMQYGTRLYLADGEGGLLVFNITTVAVPQLRGTLHFSGDAREVWAINANTVLVAADIAGLYVVDASVISIPIISDSLKFASVFPAKPKPAALHVIAIDTVAYVAAGWGGLRTVDIRDVQNISELGTWTYGGTPIEVRSVWVSGITAHIGSLDRGFFTGINVSNPGSMTGPGFPPVETGGKPVSIVVDADTAYIGDGYQGHSLIVVESGFEPRLVHTEATADLTSGAALDNAYGYAAVGRSGVYVFSLNITSPPQNRLNPLTFYNTAGQAKRIIKRGQMLYVADGTGGLSILDATYPNDLAEEHSFVVQGDTCLDVDISTSIAFLACGSRGIRTVNIGGTLAEITAGYLNTPGSARAVKFLSNRLFIADMTGVYVYDTSGLPGSGMLSVASLTGIPLSARGIDVRGDTVYVANGPYGFLMWDYVRDEVVETIGLDGSCNDIVVQENTIYVTDAGNSLKIFDTSVPGIVREVGYAPTGADALGLDVYQGRVLLADGNGGLYIYQSLIRPEVAVAPTTLNFGPVAPERTRPYIIYVENTGTTLLKITGIQTNNNRFTFSESRFNVAPGDTHQLVVYFTPLASDVGPVAGSANIYTNDATVNLYLHGIVVALVTEGPYKPDELTAGLWHLDELDGNTSIVDSTLYDNDGYLQGTAAHSDTAKYGRSVRFNKNSSDRIVIPHTNPSFNFYNQSFTVELWFNMLAKLTTGHYILLRRGVTQTEQFQLALGAAEGIIGSVWDENGAEHRLTAGSMADLNPLQWYHLAMTWDRDSLRLYLNGVIRDTEVLRGELRYQNDEPLVIGTTTLGNAPFFGYIDEVRLSNIARQSWEFHVNRSRLTVSETSMDFGNVLWGYQRRLPVLIRNTGNESLHIQDVRITPMHLALDVSFDAPFYLGIGKDTTLTVTLSPEVEMQLDSQTRMIISSSDPTYPNLVIPLSGKGVTSLPAGAYKTDPFTIGLWHFNETGGSAVYDSSGSGFHGSWTGIERPAGKFNRSILFVKDNNYICTFEPGPSHQIRPRWGGFTVELWFNIAEIPTGEAVLLRRGPSSQPQFDLVFDGNILNGRISSTQDVVYTVTSRELLHNRWYHTALVLEEDSLAMYLNGTRESTVFFSGDMAGASPDPAIDTAAVIVGRDRESQKPFNGSVDELRISNVNRQHWEFNVNMARISVSSEIIDFGRVLLNEQRTMKLWVSNTGIDALEVSSVASSDSDVSADVAGFMLVPGARQLINLLFVPSDTLDRIGHITMETNDPFWPQRTISFFGKSISTPVYGAYDQDTFTLGLFHLDEGQGTSIADSSHPLIAGTLHGGVAWSGDGRFGKSLVFEGLNGYMSLSSNPLGQLDPYDLTVELWLSLSAKPSGEFLLFRSGTATEPDLELKCTSTSIVATLWNTAGAAQVLSSPVVSAMNINQWYHLAMSCDQDTLRLIMNNQQLSSRAFAGILSIGSSYPVVFGGSTTGGFLNGKIDEIRFSHTVRQKWEVNVVPSTVQLAPATLDFATVLVGQTRTLRFSVSNTGDQDLQIISITGGGDVFSVTGVITPFIISRSGSRFISVIYEPDTPNTTHTYSMVIASNDSLHPSRALTLRGSSTDETGLNQYTTDTHTLALYHFGESPGNMFLTDISGLNHSGRLYNGVGRMKGVFGNGLRFDGVNDWGKIDSHPDLVLDPLLESFTVECYFRTDTVSQTFIYLGFPDSANYGFSTDGQGRIVCHGFGSGGPRVNDNSWHHVALSYYHISNMGTVFLDGREIFSRAWSGISADWEGCPLIIGAMDSLQGFFEGQMDEIRISSISREPWEFQLLDPGIKVTASSAFMEAAQASFDIEVPQGITPISNGVFFYYRKGGGSGYDKKSATKGTTDWEVSVPATAVTLRGVEYYVEVITVSGDTLKYPALDPVNNPGTQSVRLSGMVTPTLLRHRQFSMISVPFQLDQAGVDSVLADDVDPYDPYRCRLFWWDNLDSVYVDFPRGETGTFLFKPGKAFWIVTHGDQQFDIGKGQNVSTDSSFNLTIEPGWNMIGAPFYFEVKWDDCSLSSDSISTLYSYDLEEGYRIDRPFFEPWKGYFIYNADDDPGNLSILPKYSEIAKAADIKRSVAGKLESEEWLIRVSLKGEDSKDLDNYMGVRKPGKEGFDIYDRAEPPPVGQNVTFYIDRSEEKTYTAQLAADIRNPGEDGYIWKCAARTFAENKNVRMEWELKGLPEDWEAFLFDPVQGTCINMRHSLSCPVPGGDKTHPFKIVAGTLSFIEAHSGGIPLEPVAFHLSQNYPNPFNPETNIKYSIPKNSDVEIEIFNALGQQIRSFQFRNQPTGYHQVLWDGKDDRGMRVSSGVYLCRLKALDQIETRKMIFLK